MSTDETIIRMLTANPEEEQPKLYEIYHENTKLHPLTEPKTQGESNNPNLTLNQSTMRIMIEEVESIVSTGGKKYLAADRHLLSHHLDPIKQTTLLDSLINRGSGRSFGVDPVTLEDAAILLDLSYGWNHKREFVSEEGSISFRYVPSAGRLYPLELYLVIHQNQNMDEYDLWHYEPNTHAIELIHHAKSEDIRSVFVECPVPMPPMILFLTGVLPRLSWKYGERAYRYALLEAGHVGQNLLLAATALNLVSCPIVGFYDDAVHDLLDVDGISEIVLYSFFIGHLDTQNSEKVLDKKDTGRKQPR